jgi:hypothetical protein
MENQTEFKIGDEVYIAVYSRTYPFITKGIIEKILPSKRYRVQRKIADAMQSRIIPTDRPIFKTRDEAYNWIRSRFTAGILELQQAEREFMLRDVEEAKKETGK